MIKHFSLTGHPRGYYKELQEVKERELGMKLFGSVGFMRREIFSSAEWINVFDENERFNSIDEIIKFYGKIFEVVQCENDGNEFRIWLRDENKKAKS